jgi:3-methyladenine DNA glycosylase AlkD
MKAIDVIKDLTKKADKEKSRVLMRFFKTGKGQYGEGDIFLGITVPEQRKVALRFKDLSLLEINKLLLSRIHEHRFTALEILVMQYESQKDLALKKKIVDFYLKNLKGVNNWDLVDTSAPYILGDFLVKDKKERKVLYNLARSKSIWQRRVAVVSTFAFIKRGDFKDILSLSQVLFKDDSDLIAKACGWMLREVGKKNVLVLKKFLEKNANKMQRVSLRYAIEKFSKTEKQKYLNM